MGHAENDSYPPKNKEQGIPSLLACLCVRSFITRAPDSVDCMLAAELTVGSQVCDVCIIRGEGDVGIISFSVQGLALARW